MFKIELQYVDGFTYLTCFVNESMNHPGDWHEWWALKVIYLSSEDILLLSAILKDANETSDGTKLEEFWLNH